MEGNKVEKYKYKILDIQPAFSEKNLSNLGYFCVGVSMNNANYFGNRLQPFVEWLEQKSDNTIIVIGDYLHRFNEKIFNNVTDDEAIRKGLALGQLFIKKLNECKIQANKFEIIHWETLINDVEIIEEYKKICHFFITNLLFRDEILASCDDFVFRQVEKGNNIGVSYEEAIKLSSNYILEEMAVFGILAKRGYKVQVYPGTQLSIFKALGNGVFPEVDAGLKHGIFVDLKIKK